MAIFLNWSKSMTRRFLSRSIFCFRIFWLKCINFLVSCKIRQQIKEAICIFDQKMLFILMSLQNRPKSKKSNSFLYLTASHFSFVTFGCDNQRCWEGGKAESYQHMTPVHQWRHWFEELLLFNLATYLAI